MESERHLVERVLTGDGGAFRVLVARYDRLVRHVVSRLIDDQHEVEELSQDVFVRVYRGLPNYRGESQLSTWIGRIAFNVAATRARRAGAVDLVSPLDDVDAGEAASLHTAIPPALEALVDEELRATVRSHVAGLHPLQRLAVTLHYLEGLPVAEVAEIMAMPVNTVKSHLLRARQALRGPLQERMRDD
jgi:RNA polymerase sigma factor (sigma-70 family)